MIFGFVTLIWLSFASAQSLSDLPACGQQCISSAVNLANTQYGCAAGNVTCYCTDPRFGYALRDCSQACGSAVQVQVLAFGTAYCDAAGVGMGSGALETSSTSSSAQPSSSTTSKSLQTSSTQSTTSSFTRSSTFASVAITSSPIGDPPSGSTFASVAATASSIGGPPSSPSSVLIGGDAQGGSDSLSAAAKAGIGVGISLGVIMVGAVVILLRRFKLGFTLQPRTAHANTYTAGSKTVTENEKMEGSARPLELVTEREAFNMGERVVRTGR